MLETSNNVGCIALLFGLREEPAGRFHLKNGVKKNEYNCANHKDYISVSCTKIINVEQLFPWALIALSAEWLQWSRCDKSAPRICGTSPVIHVHMTSHFNGLGPVPLQQNILRSLTPHFRWRHRPNRGRIFCGTPPQNILREANAPVGMRYYSGFGLLFSEISLG